MDHFQQIYANEATTYDRLVAAEDAHGELAEQLGRVAGAATTIVDIGTGTGRLAIPLCVDGKQVHGVDVAQAMLDVAAAKQSPELRMVTSVRSQPADGIGSVIAQARTQPQRYSATRHRWPESHPRRRQASPGRCRES